MNGMNAVQNQIPGINKIPHIFDTIFDTKNIERDWSFAGCKFSDTGKWTHDYHRYPAKFIPQLVEKLMDVYITIKAAHINDPFYGCGTTIVTAISRGFKASGTEVNKIAYKMTKVKSTSLEPAYLNKKIYQFLSIIKFLDNDQKKLFHRENESYRILKHGGKCCYVIGDTILKGVDILNAEVFAESLQYSGLKLDRVIKREIPSKMLPQNRDEETGRLADNDNADSKAYPVEYIVIGLKE